VLEHDSQIMDAGCCIQMQCTLGVHANLKRAQIERLSLRVVLLSANIISTYHILHALCARFSLNENIPCKRHAHLSQRGSHHRVVGTQHQLARLENSLVKWTREKQEIQQYRNHLNASTDGACKYIPFTCIAMIWTHTATGNSDPADRRSEPAPLRCR